RTLRAGESYRAPNRAGMVLATRNAGALQLFVDGKSAGAAGPAGKVLSDMPLDPATLSGQ
ncbi:MAG: RodZ domain-containing protein, partial [Pseudomonadota bacterium]